MKYYYIEVNYNTGSNKYRENYVCNDYSNIEYFIGYYYNEYDSYKDEYVKEITKEDYDVLVKYLYDLSELDYI